MEPLLVASKARVDITQKYDLKAEVGEGTYGLVYQAEQKGKQIKVAIKKFRSTKEGEGVSFICFSFSSILLLCLRLCIELGFYSFYARSAFGRRKTP